MNISTHPNTIRTIKQGDSNWIIQNGFTLAPRAGFKIDDSCPHEYRLVLQRCINQGWIAPIANVLERELSWEEMIK